MSIITFLILGLVFGLVENKSIFGIGNRIKGDQLLVKDVLYARSIGLEYSPMIKFNYALVEPITCIEIISDENVYAEVRFSYQHDLVEGTVTAINSTTAPKTNEPFEVLIRIYGFLETNINSDYILNRNEHYRGLLEPHDNDGIDYQDVIDADGNDDEDDDDSAEYIGINNGTMDEFDEENITFLTNKEDVDEDEDDDIDTEFDNKDKVIEIGQRQSGDELIYDTLQTSATTTELPSSHSVIFYYIDSPYITCLRFLIFDHFADKKTTAVDYEPPSSEYSHFSAHSFKAVITDHNITSLFVQMFVFGYKPQDVPVDYTPFLKQSLPADINFNIGHTETPVSPLQRLKNLMIAERRKQHEDEANTNDGSAEADGNQNVIAPTVACGHNNALSLVSQNLLINFFVVVIVCINALLLR